MIPAEHAQKIALWRQHAVDGTLTREECAEFVRLCRAGRMTAQAASTAAKRGKAIKEIPSAAVLASGLDDLP